MVTGAATVTNGSIITGGNGGTGGQGNSPVASPGGSGGNGGNGGTGITFAGTGAKLTNTGTIQGGNGGAGAAGGTGDNGGNGGAGGGGGNNGVEGNNLTLTNTGMIFGGTGGAGGAAGSGGVNGSAGAVGTGGAGVFGSGLTIINSGSISGGLGGDGVTRADAILFTGGINSLTLQAGSTITGNVVAFSTADTLALGGTSNASFDVSQIGSSAKYQGFGIFQKTGSSTWTLSGTNATATPWTVTAGVLNVSTDGALGATAGGVTLNGGTFQFGASFATNAARSFTLNATTNTIDTNGNNGAIAGAIGGPGGFTKTGTGTLLLSGANTYSGPTNVNFGVLAGGATNTFSPISAFSIAPGAVLNLGGFSQIIGSLAGGGIVTTSGAAVLTTGGNNSSTTFGGVIQNGAGALGLNKAGTGTLTLSGTNAYTGGTTISAGILQLGNGGASGSITGNVTDNSIFAINRSDAFSYGGVISGSGAFQQNGTGTTSLTAANTYTGGTTISAGTLAISGSGSITSNVTNNATFANSGAVVGTVTNTATFNNNVGGTVSGLLTNNSGTATNSGALNGGAVVNGGLLSVSGTAAAVTVNAGGTLGGNGIVGNTTINGGVLAPGNSIGLLTVQGNLVFTAAASYMIEVSPANADRTNVTGTATLGGARECIVCTGYLRRQAIHHRQCDRRRERYLQRPGQHQPSFGLLHQPELRRQRRVSQSAVELRAAARDRPLWQPAERRQRHHQLLQHHGRHPDRVRRSHTGGAVPAVRRSRDRIAADHVQCDGPASWDC